MKPRFVITFAVYATLSVIPVSESLKLYQWISSPLASLRSISQVTQSQNLESIRNQHFGRKIERVKRASSIGREVSWKTNFKKFRRNQTRKNSKTNFYKTWKPTPFVPIIRVIPTEATTSASIHSTPPVGNNPPKTGVAPPKIGDNPTKTGDNPTKSVSKPNDPGPNSPKPVESAKSPTAPVEPPPPHNSIATTPASG